MRYEIKRYAVVTSTMDVAGGLADGGADEGVVVVADEQSAGRGRAAHSWYSPPGQSLYLSIVLRPKLALGQLGWITMIAALAVLDEINDIACSTRPDEPSLVTLKWFNDVLIRERKVCGILVESSITGDTLDYAVLGVGLNVNTRFDGAPQAVRDRATSLVDAYGGQASNAADGFDRDGVLQGLLARFSVRYERLLHTRTNPVAEYARCVSTLGREVRILSGDKIVAGRALRIADDGALIVLTAQGERRIGFGEIVG